MNRKQRRLQNTKNKETTFTYKESELRKIIEAEAERHEEYYYHLATKLLIVASIHALKDHFKFGKQRIIKYIDAITKVYTDISEDKKLFKEYNQMVIDMGIDIQFKKTNGAIKQ